MPDTVTRARLWEPPAKLSKKQMVKISDAVLAEPDIPFAETEDVFRIHSNGLDWDIGNIVYAPNDPAKIAVGPDGKKLAILMTHGGASAWRAIERLGPTFPRQRGCKGGPFP